MSQPPAACVPLFRFHYDVLSGESADRNGTSLPGDQLEYLRAAAHAQTKTVVVAMSLGSLTMDWANEAASVLCFFMPGQGQGSAVARVLFGDVNPSGNSYPCHGKKMRWDSQPPWP